MHCLRNDVTLFHLVQLHLGVVVTLKPTILIRRRRLHCSVTVVRPRARDIPPRTMYVWYCVCYCTVLAGSSNSSSLHFFSVVRPSARDIPPRTTVRLVLCLLLHSTHRLRVVFHCIYVLFRQSYVQNGLSLLVLDGDCTMFICDMSTVTLFAVCRTSFAGTLRFVTSSRYCYTLLLLRSYALLRSTLAYSLATSTSSSPTVSHVSDLGTLLPPSLFFSLLFLASLPPVFCPRSRVRSLSSLPLVFLLLLAESSPLISSAVGSLP